MDKRHEIENDFNNDTNNSFRLETTDKTGYWRQRKINAVGSMENGLSVLSHPTFAAIIALIEKVITISVEMQ